MLDVLFAVVALALPITTWLVSRSLVWTATRLILAFGLAGNAAQTAIALGVDWSTRELQWLALIAMGVVLGLAFRRRDLTSGSGTMRRQVVGVAIPVLALTVFLIGMRLLAPESASPMAGFGYLINHPLAEDNAKWLHLTSQLATEDPVSFNGYAGGPLLLLMALVAAVVSVISMILLGGVNEVAVAVNTLLMTQFLLIALVPVALSPFAEGSLGSRHAGKRIRVASPLLWVGGLVLFAASAVVTSYGHLSFQFILIILTLWAAVFLVPGRDSASRIVMTLAIATSASVWVPLNVLGATLAIGLVAWALWRRRWGMFALSLATLVLSWDALFSSLLYLLGIDLGGAGEPSNAAAPSTVSLPPQVLAATHLFAAPGGTEIVQPLLGALALASVLLVVARHPRISLHARSLRGLLPVFPIAALGVYVALISIGDGIVTGGAPHYGGHKLTFALTVMALAATLPLAVTLVEPGISGMSVFKWMAGGSVVLLLVMDTILPRAVSALSPQLWPGVDATAPAYWVPAEVKDQADQPISSLPVACLFTPPQTTVPSGTPLGQQSYTCTRLLTGLNGLEGEAGNISAWLATDWQSNQQTWDQYYSSLVESTGNLRGRTVIAMTPEYGVAGLVPWDVILERYSPRQ